MIEGDEVALAFTYLASDNAAMVTGATLVIDGGETVGSDKIFIFDDQ